MMVPYKEFTQLNLPAFEKEVLKKWQEENTFEESINNRSGAPSFVFYEGPPSANGLPGIHHVISRTLKDLVCRYKTMQGFQVFRKGGWDTHGLPIELGVEKELGITKEDIGKKISVEEYNQKCRDAVLRYKDKWDEITTKMGYWVDLNNPYITYENNYIESVWWLLQSLYRNGLLYESVSIQPYSPAAGTGLSSHELNQPGTYKDVKDTSATVMFTLKDDAEFIQKRKKNLLLPPEIMSDFAIAIMAWTTTPWTLPSNLGLTVGAGIDYALVHTFNPYTQQQILVILAEKLIPRYFKPENENADFSTYKKDGKHIPYKILEIFQGKELEGLSYEQLLPFTANSMEQILAITPDATPFKIVTADFVTTEDGTGIVHTAPAFGADDFKVGQKNNLGILTLVDRQGRFIDGVGAFSNRYVKNYTDEENYVDVNVDIAVQLKLEGKAFKVEKYEHSYPHCWRTDKPILYYPLDAWFIKTTALKNKMIALNQRINWKPENTGTGRFGNWLENMVDWNLSRSRFWGTPLPIWKTDDGTEEICIGSVEELNKEIKKAAAALGGDTNQHYLHEGILDLHKPYVDDITLVSASGKPMKRVADLIDVWFDSGAMPFAQLHFPFENKETFSRNYPADFIAEGVDQTRGWFYTLHAISCLVEETVMEELKKDGLWENSGMHLAKSKQGESLTGAAYKTVVSNGLVLDKNGVKMSKRLGNIVDPFATIDSFGADATRWYLITNASPWDNLKFDLEGIREVQRKFFGTLYNTYQFFTLYANVDEFDFSEKEVPLNDRPEIDRWILSSLHSLIQTVTEAFNDYEPTTAGRAIEEFVDSHLSNWYVRLCRRRFWKPEAEEKGDKMGTDKLSAYQTLYECLETIAKLIAPIAPFFCDTLFVNLNTVTKRTSFKSVHHTRYPVADAVKIDPALEERMLMAQDACSLILSLRKKVTTGNGETGIKVRQPLQKVMIPVYNPNMEEQLRKVAELIKAEVNVKEIEYLDPDNAWIHKKIKPNFVLLGKKFGAKMKAVSQILADFSQDQITELEKNGAIKILIGQEEVELKTEEVEISTEDMPGWAVASKGLLTTALDITITPELEKEGYARELINRIQKIRKDSNLKLTDRINVQITDIPKLSDSVIAFNEYICGEILADKLDMIKGMNQGVEVLINDYQLFVNLNVKEN
jgi:isoleucyl-tRNA synthetase